MNSSRNMTRSELLKWINTILHMNVQSFEKVYNGAISCQIMHMIYPDSIPMNKVNFLAIDQFECQKNYRLLQTAFTKKKIPFNLDIEKLSKGRPQDNLELIQYMRELFDRAYDEHPYDAPASRSQSKGGKSMNYTLQDLEVMENERAMNSASSLGSTPRSSYRVQKHPLGQLQPTTTPTYPTIPHPTSRRPLGARPPTEQAAEIDSLRARSKELEHLLVEREKMIECLGKEGASMYKTMRKVEDCLLDLQEKGETMVSIETVLNLLYDNFVVEHPPEEEEWVNGDLSIHRVNDSFDDELN